MGTPSAFIVKVHMAMSPTVETVGKSFVAGQRAKRMHLLRHPPSGRALLRMRVAQSDGIPSGTGFTPNTLLLIRLGRPDSIHTTGAGGARFGKSAGSRISQSSWSQVTYMYSV